jgi:hypothetical protein
LARRIAQTVSPDILDRLGFQERFECWNRDELEPMLEMYAEDAVFDEFEECLDLGTGKVAFFAHVKVQGEASGVALTDEKLGFVVDVSDGMAVRGRFCRKAEALEAVGLRDGTAAEAGPRDR